MKGSQPRVLVVEEDPNLLETEVQELTEMGLESDAAADGRRAIELMTLRPPDLVCLDLVLPELSGYAVCEFIRRSPGLSDIPILMTSSRSLPEDRAVAEETGASAYLVQPFSSKEFRRTVRALVSNGRAQPSAGNDRS